jgi:tRNA(fMet)-specific endonuclease VapC
MLILDTDHVSEYQLGNSAEARRLSDRLDAVAEPFGTTIITIEEMMRGWMAAVRRTTDVQRQVRHCARLQQLFQFFGSWNALEWNLPAASQFEALRKARVRVSTMDLKIASICLANDAILLTRNARDFQSIPGLRFQDWLS